MTPFIVLVRRNMENKSFLSAYTQRKIATLFKNPLEAIHVKNKQGPPTALTLSSKPSVS
jgi:hypothetical protein